jgi:hypothetical protein
VARDIYNFIWIIPLPPPPTIGPAGQRSPTTVAAATAITRGVILFPNFMTPLVHIDGHEEEPWLELLIATERALTREMVNRQLKISANLRAEKPVSASPLFPGAAGNIIVESAGEVDDDGETILSTHSKFSGILHPSYGEALSDKDITRVYKVKIRVSGLPNSSPPDEYPYSSSTRKFTGYRMHEGSAQRYTQMAVQGGELSDQMIREMLNRRFGADSASNPNTLPSRGRYAFPMSGNTVDISRVDPNSPIQSYHPLFVLSGDDASEYVSLGHVSDIHVNTRWQILGRSTARVIEYGDGQYEDESPKIGDLLGENNRSFHSVLRRVCGEADVMIVGGDIVDHIRNAYNADRVLSRTNTPVQIWDAMNIDGDAYTEATYPIGLDLIAFYSFILDAMTSHSRPVFGITGNHDCYVDAFGISPRLNALVTTSRTNEGIPADLNLTYYEALLSFGPSAGLLRSASSSFDAEWFDWFHTVLTPFNDWWFKFPKQSLVGLGWGTTEDLIDMTGEQSYGHLPRSDDAVTDAQLELLRNAVNQRSQRKVILTSHFTFLSYLETVPMHPGGARSSRGTFHVDTFNRFEMGTFESNRDELMNMLAGRQLQVVLTGHSHRRGLHLLGSRSGDEIPCDLFDTDPNDSLSLCQIPSGLTAAEPAIIVSDSAGPYPRYNRDGEFLGWGSDRPGGTVVKFSAHDGKLSEVKTLSASNRRKARGAVAMDYTDVSSQGALINNRMETEWVTAEQDSGAAPDGTTPIWYIQVPLTAQVHTTWGIYIERVVFAGRHRDRWIRVEASYDSTHNAFKVAPEQTADFRTWARSVLQPTRFVSLKLGSRNSFIANRYDWNSWWNFEVMAQALFQHMPVANSPRMQRYVMYRIFRPQRELSITRVGWGQSRPQFREVPNFDWRRANDPKYAD